MDLDDYANRARSTKIYSVEVIYPTIKLAGEVGEVSELIGKVLRGDYKDWKSPEFLHKIILELGDPLWYIANLSLDLGFTLNEVAWANVKKLQRRKALGLLKGAGSER